MNDIYTIGESIGNTTPASTPTTSSSNNQPENLSHLAPNRDSVNGPPPFYEELNVRQKFNQQKPPDYSILNLNKLSK